MERKLINHMKLEFPSRSCNESFARTAVAGFVAQLDPLVSELTEIKTAVSEAVTNSIVHGYGDSDGTVYITVKLFEDGLIVITVRDTGRGIEDISLSMEPMFTTCDTGERSGMGFTIMKNFMDRLSVWSRINKGTRVTMEKKIKLRT